MVEKRRYVRFNAPLRVDLFGCGGSDLPAFGRMVDFSRQGLRIAFSGALSCPPESMARVRTVLPENDRTVEFGVRVKWSRQGAGAWEAGCSLENIDPETKSELLDYIYNHWKRNTSDGENESK